MSSRPVPLVRQVLALQIALIAVVAGIGFVLAASLLESDLVAQYGQRALGVARAVASDPDLGDAVARDDPDVRGHAERARLATGALFVVVTDERGIRLAHPNPAAIGKPVSTDPWAALAGREVVNLQRGSLGMSARGKVPLRDRAGRIVGEVSVGFDAGEIDAARLRMLGNAAVFTGGALLLGVVGSMLLTRLLKRRTLGLEPHELTELVQEHEAVLHAVGEGVLAVDADKRVSVCNTEAGRLLGTSVRPGTPVADLRLPARLRALLADRRPAGNLLAVAGERVLVANHRPVTRNGRNLGSVLSLRDRTDLETLTRELDSVRKLTDALRAQRHEFTNRLHTLSGLLQTGHHQEAVEYLQALHSSAPLDVHADAVADPYLRAFLAAKTASAQEKGVSLRVGETSWVPSRVVTPVEVTTVLGNLVDNALEAARLGARRPAAVEVDLLADGAALHMSVVDTGDGVPESLGESVFGDGVSTREEEGRGMGLVLARQAARSLGGDVSLADAGGDEHGAVFVAWLPEVLAGRGGVSGS